MTTESESVAPHPGYRRPAWHFWGGGVLLVLILLALFLYLFNWNWMRGPISRYASHRTGRVVRIDGDLKVHLFSWTPTATVNGLKISNPNWAGKGQTADIPRLTVQARLLPLLMGHVILPHLELDRPHFVLLRDEQGRATWEFSTNAKDNVKPLKLPPIQNFAINDGQIDVTDLRRHLILSGTLQSHEKPGKGEHSAFSMQGKGTLNRRPFLMEITGGPLLNIDRAKPYPFNMRVRAGATRADANGAVIHPFNLGELEAEVTFAGPNLADGYYLTGIALPNTSPYRLSAHVSRHDTVYTVTKMTGTIGSSDLEGDMKVDVTSGRPYVTADLKSRLLDFIDLGPLFGGRPSPAHLALAAEKAGISKADAAEDAAPVPSSGRFLPDMPLNVDRVRQMDANIIYKAERIRSTALPLHQLVLGLTLDHGVMAFNPISLDFSRGKLAGTARIDARNRTPDVDTDIRVRDLSLQQFIHIAQDKDAIEGHLEGRVKLHGAGKSVHTMASSANGNVTFVVPSGIIRQRFAELLGIDLDRALLFSGDKDTGLRCAITDFQAHNGTLAARNLTLDTDVVNATGSGSISLDSEAIDLTIKGSPKKFTFFRVRAPITVGGTLSHPSVGVKAGAVATQVGIAVALGALLTPAAAILPFVDPGLAHDTNCGALIGEAKSKGGPVPAHRKIHH